MRHDRAAFDPEMMVALLLYGYCQGERSSRVTGKRCVRDVGYRVITGGLHPDHATIARFRARHEQALGGLFSRVLRLLAAEGMMALGMLSLDGTKLAGNAAQKANKTLPQIEKLLAEAAAADAAEDAQQGEVQPVTPRALARRAERRERLAAARDRLAAEDQARRGAQRARQQAWDAAAAEGRPRAPRRPPDQPRTNRNNTEPPTNITVKPPGVSGDSRCWEDRSHGTCVELLARAAGPGGADGCGADAGLSLAVRRDLCGGQEAGHRHRRDAAQMGAPGRGRCG
jgi:hypothetical protein